MKLVGSYREFKKCSTCGEIKRVDAFNYHRQRNCYRSECKECAKEKANLWLESAGPKEWYGFRRSAAKTRAKKKQCEFDLPPKPWEGLIFPTHCEVFGWELSYSLRQEGGGRRPNAASFDRIDSSRGYTVDNVRIISARANTLRNDSTIEELKLLIDDAIRLQIR